VIPINKTNDILQYGHAKAYVGRDKICAT